MLRLLRKNAQEEVEDLEEMVEKEVEFQDVMEEEEKAIKVVKAIAVHQEVVVENQEVKIVNLPVALILAVLAENVLTTKVPLAIQSLQKEEMDKCKKVFIQ